MTADEFHAAVLAQAEVGIWAVVAVGFILCFTAGVLVAKAVW